MPAENPACKLSTGSRIRPADPDAVPDHLLAGNAAGWAIVRYSMKAGLVTDAAIVDSQPKGLLDAYALAHVRKNRNPLAPDADDCMALIALKVS